MMRRPAEAFRRLVVTVSLALLPAAASAQSVTLAWDGPLGDTVAGYQVQFGTAPGVWTSSVDAGAQNQFTVTGLVRGRTYYFVVRAYNADGIYSDPSSEVFTTVPYIDRTPAPNEPGLELMYQHTDGRLMSARYSAFTQAGLYEILAVRNPDPEWIVAGLADFNADDSRDILWQHRVTGHLAVWLMNGSTFLDGVMLTPSDPGGPDWRVSAVGDLDADGKPDLVLRNRVSGLLAAWFMNGTRLRDGALLSPSTVDDPGWRVVSAADFDGDRKADLLWQHANGTTAAWLMNGHVLRDGASLTPSRVADTQWVLIGSGRANADNFADLVWWHGGMGATAIWMMNGFNLVDGAMLTSLPMLESGWRLVATR